MQFCNVEEFLFVCCCFKSAWAANALCRDYLATLYWNGPYTEILLYWNERDSNPAPANILSSLDVLLNPFGHTVHPQQYRGISSEVFVQRKSVIDSMCQNLFHHTHYVTCFILFIFLKHHICIHAYSSAIICGFQLEWGFYSHFNLACKIQHKTCSVYNIKYNTLI